MTRVLSLALCFLAEVGFGVGGEQGFGSFSAKSHSKPTLRELNLISARNSR